MTVYPTRALSIRQPWCHRILYEGKDVENRTWRANFRGPFLIHASKKPEGIAECRALGAPLGGIVGMAEIIDCVDTMESDWFFGPYGFVLANVQALEFIPCKGALGFFRPEINIDDLKPLQGRHVFVEPEKKLKKVVSLISCHQHRRASDD